MSRRGAAKLYKVSYSAAINWVARSSQTGSPAAFPMGGKKPFKLAEESDWILRRLADNPDITGRELLAELHERKVMSAITRSGIFWIAPASAIKKTLRAAEQDRPDVARRRALWQRLQGKVEARRI